MALAVAKKTIREIGAVLTGGWLERSVSFY